MTTSFNTNDFAIYLPAVNDAFAGVLTKPLVKQRQFPKSLSVDDLAFWRSGNSLFHHPYILHSVGLHPIGSRIDNAITRIPKSSRILVGDSGGYQIGKGKLGGLKSLKQAMPADAAVNAWDEADDVRSWIVNWLETNCQYAMTLDMPLWAVTETGKCSPFHRCSVSQLTSMSVDNLRYIDIHRQGNAKWLNVIQGIDEQTTNEWFQAVKWFKQGGWALAGAAGVRGGLELLLKAVLMMRDEGAFEEGQDWLHVLGTSSVHWAITLTAIQRCLRKTNPKLTVSYDSSSPFQIGGRYERLCLTPKFGENYGDWNIGYVQSPQGEKYVGSSEAFPVSSPLGDQITLGDLNIYEQKYRKRRYDSLSLAMLSHHNTFIYLQSFDKANEIVFNETKKSQIPKFICEYVACIENAFDRSNWYSYLMKNQLLLSRHSKSRYKPSD